MSNNLSDYIGLCQLQNFPFVNDNNVLFDLFLDKQLRMHVAW